jgi:hypothetical protein
MLSNRNKEKDEFTVTYFSDTPKSGICQMRICELYVDPSNEYI